MSEKLLARFKDIDSSYTDFKRYQEPTTDRDAAKSAFIDDETWAPEFSYPKIDKFYDSFDDSDKESKNDTDKSIAKKKTKVQLAVFALDRISTESPEAALYADYHQVRLQRIMLNEASYHMMTAGTEEARWVAAEEFRTIGQELYGEMDQALFAGLLGAEKQRVLEFEPKTEIAEKIKADLQSFFDSSDTELGATAELISPEALARIHEALRARYPDIINVFESADQSVMFDAESAAELINQALEAGGLKAGGWKAVVDKKKQTPATSPNLKKISLPANLSRNAAQLLRLTMHEQEVHARRAFNGDATGYKVLQNGTADYADVEEGLGVLFEAAISGSFAGPATARAEERYIAAGIATGLFGPARDARQTHEILWRILAVKSHPTGEISNENVLAAKKASTVHIENAFRGTPTTMPGVIYPKLKVYYEGLVKNCRLFEEYEGDMNELLDEVLAGKYDHTSPKEKELVFELIGQTQSATIKG